jgi:hypothetical protein
MIPDTMSGKLHTIAKSIMKEVLTAWRHQEQYGFLSGHWLPEV